MAPLRSLHPALTSPVKVAQLAKCQTRSIQLQATASASASASASSSFRPLGPIAAASRISKPLKQCRASQSHTAPSQCRNFASTPSRLRSDDPGGKINDGSHPTVYDDFYNMLESTDPNQEPALAIEAISPERITLSDGLVLTSPVILVNGHCFMWDAPHLDPNALPSGKGWEEWEENVAEVWKLVEVIEPKPEVLLFGTGKAVLPPPPRTRSFINSLGIQIDVQSSQNAASTYNVLSEEGRRVAVALIPSNRQPLTKFRGEEDEAARIQTGPSSNAIPPPSSSSTLGSSSNGSRPFSTSTRPQTTPPKGSEALSRPFSSTARATLASNAAASEPEFLSLKHFLMRSKALALYRGFIRATRDIPNPVARWETIQWYRDEIEREKHVRDLDRLRDLLAQGHRTLKMLQGSMSLSNVDVDEEGKMGSTRLRGLRST